MPTDTDTATLAYRRTTGRRVHIHCPATRAVIGTATVTGVRIEYCTGRKLIDTDCQLSYSLATRAERGGQTFFSFAD